MSDSLFLKQVAVFTLLLITFFTSGCSIPFPVYSVSGKNIQALRAIPASVEVGQITGDQTDVFCRMRPLGPQDGVTFAEYIAKALNEEIIIAGGTKTDKKVTISGTLREIDVDCGMASASWVIEMDISVDNQPSFPVKTVHEFGGNFSLGVVFNRARESFVPTIQDLVNDVINHPSFQAAVK